MSIQLKIREQHVIEIKSENTKLKCTHFHIDFSKSYLQTKLNKWAHQCDSFRCRVHYWNTHEIVHDRAKHYIFPHQRWRRRAVVVKSSAPSLWQNSAAERSRGNAEVSFMKAQMFTALWWFNRPLASNSHSSRTAIRRKLRILSPNRSNLANFRLIVCQSLTIRSYFEMFIFILYCIKMYILVFYHEHIMFSSIFSILMLLFW